MTSAEGKTNYLEYWRKKRHLSLNKLSLKMGGESYASTSTLNRWERGTIKEWAIPILATILKISEEELLFGPSSLSLPQKSIQIFPRNQSILSISEEETTMLVAKPNRVNDEMKNYLDGQLKQLWESFHTTEDSTNTTSLRMALINHIRTLETIATWSIAGTDKYWLKLALCEAAILAGRIARDEMDYEKAATYHKRAMKLALETKSDNHIAAAAMRLGETLWEAGLPFEALSYCQYGIEMGKAANARIKGELACFTAEVFGSLGELAQSKRLTEEATMLASGASRLPTAGGINFSETAAASYMMDEALRQNDPSSALEWIIKARSLLTTEFPKGQNIRWEAHLWINQARVHKEGRDIEAACVALKKAAYLATNIHSRIALRKVQDTTRRLLETGEHQTAVRSLQEELLNLTRRETLA